MSERDIIESDLPLQCKGLTDDEKLILKEGCLMNYYAAGYGKA